MMREKTVLGGILFALAYCLVAVVYGIAKYLQAKWGFHPAELTFFNFTIVAVCLLPWVIREGGLKAFKSDKFSLLMHRAVYGFGLAYLGLTAAHLLPLMDAMTLLNTAPLWVVIMAMFFLRERLSKKTAFCILGGFIGMILVMRPRLQGMNFTGDLVALAAGLFLAACPILLWCGGRFVKFDCDDPIL